VFIELYAYALWWRDKPSFQPSILLDKLLSQEWHTILVTPAF
jgi:hypothetical protein